MNFPPVPGGTTPAAALVLRGGEHDVVVDAMHHLVVQGASFTKPIAAPGAGADRLMQYSNAAGALAGSLFTEDPTVLCWPQRPACL